MTTDVARRTMPMDQEFLYLDALRRGYGSRANGGKLSHGKFCLGSVTYGGELLVDPRDREDYRDAVLLTLLPADSPHLFEIVLDAEEFRREVERHYHCNLDGNADRQSLVDQFNQAAVAFLGADPGEHAGPIDARAVYDLLVMVAASADAGTLRRLIDHLQGR